MLSDLHLDRRYIVNLPGRAAARAPSSQWLSAILALPWPVVDHSIWCFHPGQRRSWMPFRPAAPSPALLSQTSRRRLLISIARWRFAAVLAVLIQTPLEFRQSCLLCPQPPHNFGKRIFDQDDYGLISGIVRLSDFRSCRYHCPILCAKVQNRPEQLQIFCFDLTLMRLCIERQIGPGFLVHDSHLFDGVDERQVAMALQIGARMSQELGFQYIVTMNSDVMPKETLAGFNLEQYVLSQRLTDATDDRGLFGFRFN